MLQAMQERDVTTGRWAQEQLQRGYELLQLQQKESQEDKNKDAEAEEKEESSCDRGSSLEDSVSKPDDDHKNNRMPRSLSEEDADEIAEALERRRSSAAPSPVSLKQSEHSAVLEEGEDREDSDTTEGNKEYKKGFTVNNYFEFLVDGELMGKAYALKEVVSSCDRITQWVHLNQKWADCLECMENKLSQYNMADHMLRYAITINAHIRVISFFLAVAGADPNSQDRWLRTPLHFAAVHNRPDVVRVLLLAGADSSIPGALNKSLLIAPTPSSISGALKSGRMVTPTVLCQATYGNSLASYPAALSILRGKACILCNTLEATSLTSVAKRRHSRILTGRHIPNMQVQASVRTGDASTTTSSSADISSPSPSPSGRVVISNCPRCNIPMCAWCLPDHHCIHDIIQEEFTWKVNLVQKATRASSKSSDTSSVTSSAEAADGNAKSSKRGSKALRQLGKTLFMRRPSLFGRSPREKDVIRHLEADSEDSDSDERSCGSFSTASGELIALEDEDEDDEQDNEKEEEVEESLERHCLVDVVDIISKTELEADTTNENRKSDVSHDSHDSGFQNVHVDAAVVSPAGLRIEVCSEQTAGGKEKGQRGGGEQGYNLPKCCSILCSGPTAVAAPPCPRIAHKVSPPPRVKKKQPEKASVSPVV